MKFLPSFLSVKWTIGRQIALALGAMGAVTGGITGISVLGSHQAATLVANTFDQGLVATTFARALADDFGRIRADVAQNRNGRSLTVTVLDKSFQADLTAVLAQMPSPAVTAASEDLRDAETDWLARSRRLDPRAAPPASLLTELDEAGKAVDRKIEALVDLVVDIAHGYREAAGQAMVAQSGAALVGGLGAVVAALLCAAYLLRSIRAPIARATAFAREIATGNLKARPPGAGSNEVGDLIRAITAMHVRAQNNVAQQAARQTDLHNQVSEALNGSQEGVVVADADGTIRVANRRAMDFLGIADKHLAPGTTLDEVRRLVGLQDRTRQALLQLPDDEPGPREITIPDGRHILIDRYATSAGGFAGHYTDITSIVNQREDLIVSKSNFDAALTNMNQALCVFDHGYRLKIANGRFYALFGLDPSEATVGTAYPALLDMSIRRGNHPGIDPDRLRRHERFICARKGRTHRSIVFRDGRTLTITQTPIQNGGWLATYEDITEQRQANDRIAHVARHDALTNLPNRAFLLSRLELALVRARGEGVAVLYLDLDQFKQVNDTLGHATGDTLLKMVASRLEALVQGPDMVARLGGDEFAVLQTRVSGREQSATLAARIIETVSAPYLIEGSTLRIGTSIGIAVSPKDGSSTGHLMKNADLALYRAKEEGRNAFRFYEAEMQERLTARLTLEADLRRAVINKEFELHFQPLLDVASMQIGSFEALLRWRHPVNGIISPVVFIPVAEQMEIMSGIGAWVLGEACRQAMRWPRTIRVAVNVSVVQLRDGAFTDVVRKALAASGLAPERLELEITESIFMANNAKAMDSLLAIKGTGVKIAMDDFGTGYSSLSYLRRFAFDKIKIDRAFVSDLVDSDGEHLLRTIVTLGRNFGMRVTAEGVETPRQLKHLADIGCDEVQGYLIGRPIPADMTRATLEQHNGRQGLDELAA